MGLAHYSAIGGTDGQIVNSKSKMVNPEFLRPGHLKKQSQFAGCPNERKPFSKNGLWRFCRFGAPPKTKPIQTCPEQRRTESVASPWPEI
jgi:hypothetical protein